MPLVRIWMLKGCPDEFSKKVREVVYHDMVDTINVLVNDKFNSKEEDI